MTLRSASDPNYIRPLTRLIDRAAGPLDFDGYQAEGGYAAFRKVVTEQWHRRTCRRPVKDSNLRGRGGAGFPTGVKWRLIPLGPDAGTKYLVCNADEMEPGTFKDRLLMEQAPHQLIEAMLIAAYAIQATTGYIFLRGEYVAAAERLNEALAEARAAGYVGANILGSPWSFELYVHTGAGRYICGEETALINSLEGRRANPRAKPPFPQVAGLWGRPTIVNNVETLSNLPHIVANGADWFKSLSARQEPGQRHEDLRLFGPRGQAGLLGIADRHHRARNSRSACGRHERRTQTEGVVARRRLHRLPVAGTSRPRDGLRNDPESGFADGHRLDHGRRRRPEHGLRGAQPRRVLRARIVRLVHAVPRRLAVEREDPAGRSKQGRGQAEDIEVLSKLTRWLGPGKTFCPHAPGAMEPLQSALKFFRAEFEAGLAPVRRATAAKTA